MSERRGGVGPAPAPGLDRRSFLLAALATGVAACAGEDSPAPAPPEAAPAAPPAPDRAPTVVWGADNIGELLPKAPPRTTAVPTPVPPLPAYDTALGILGGVVDTWASLPGNAWAVAHGVLARGPEHRMADGTNAIEHLVTTYGELHEVGGRALFGFPRKLGDTLVEPHTDLILKNLGEVGASPDLAFTLAGRSVTLADLYRYTLLRSFLVPKENRSAFASPNDTPWALQALCQWAPDDEVQWKALDGTPMDLDDLASFVVAVLTQESAWMFERMQKGERFEKQGQNLFNYTCGGAHLLQGASYAVARGFGAGKVRAAVEAQVGLWFYRLPIELSIYDEVLARHPKQSRRLLAQRMKFLGHFLESLSKMMAMGLFTATQDQAVLLEGALQNLTLTVDALHKQGAFDDLARLKEQDLQLHLDLIGDAAHAIRGMELALGRQMVRW